MNIDKNAVYLFISETGLGAEHAWSRIFGTEMPAIARTERGKPYFPSRPDIHFNVSHSGKYFVCAFSGSPVGIDIQEHTLRKGETEKSAAPRLQKIAARFFHPAEKKYIKNDTFLRFYRVWTAKEAFVKYTGKGIDGDFSKFSAITDSIPPLEPGKPALWHTDNAHFLQMMLDDGYTICICAKEKFDFEIIK